jgi:hypothetical protein
MSQIEPGVLVAGEQRSHADDGPTAVYIEEATLKEECEALGYGLSDSSSNASVEHADRERHSAHDTTLRSRHTAAPLPSSPLVPPLGACAGGGGGSAERSSRTQRVAWHAPAVPMLPVCACDGYDGTGADASVVSMSAAHSTTLREPACALTSPASPRGAADARVSSRTLPPPASPSAPAMSPRARAALALATEPRSPPSDSLARSGDGDGRSSPRRKRDRSTWLSWLTSLRQGTSDTLGAKAGAELLRWEVPSRHIEWFRRQKELGRGSFGTVYEVQLKGGPRRGQRVAAKRFDVSSVAKGREQLVEMLRRECALTTALTRNALTRNAHARARSRAHSLARTLSHTRTLTHTLLLTHTRSPTHAYTRACTRSSIQRHACAHAYVAMRTLLCPRCYAYAAMRTLLCAGGCSG